MRLESAVSASREGLNAHGQAIAVVGDNVSNVSTVGYKEARAEFSDLFSDGSGSSDNIPSSGAGVTISQVRQLHQSGSLDFTGRELDFAIEGNGFFMFGDPANPYFGRAGNFQLDGSGNLVDRNGNAVLGIAPGGAALSPLNLLNIDTAGRASTAATLVGNVDASSTISTPPTNPQTYGELGSASAGNASFDIYDSLGARHTVDIYFFKTASGSWTGQAYMNGADINGGTEGVPSSIGSLNLQFGSDGLMTTDPATLTINAQYSNGAVAGAVAVDMGSYTQYAAPTVQSSTTVDGQSVGRIVGFETGKDGTIFGVLDNGARVSAGQLQLATFPNLSGLIREGNGLYTAGATTGDLQTGVAGTGAFGTVQGGALEQSTVDLPKQFVDLLIFQRGYQASSQSLNTANTLLRETLQLIR